MTDALINLLNCPVCAGSLRRIDTGLECAACGGKFPERKGRPVLVPGVTGSKDDAAKLVAAADSLPPRETVAPRVRPPDRSVQDYFFRDLFPRFERSAPHWAFLGEKVAQMVAEIPADAAVLDIGAGDCKYGALLAGRRYVAVDLVYSSDAHQFAPLDVLADASALPFRAASFDVALNLVVLEHVPDPARVIQEMARVLKPGGLAYALIPLVRPEHLVPFDFHRFTRYGIRQLFERHGLEILSTEESNGSFWTAIHYARQIAMTRPLLTFGRRSVRGVFWNRFWWLIFQPLATYGRLSNQRYGGDFPIYFWVRARRVA